MAGDWPTTDTRRASKLRDALAKSAPMLAPDWAGLRQDGDFGRALLEIAARLAEHSTSRLDRTALRDKLAFLDTLDVATPPPQSATAPIVFTLAEKRDTPVFAPARAQLTAAAGKEEISFETREAIDLSPARLAALIAADPAADRIETAPAQVTGSLAEPVPPTRYLLLSAVEAGAKALQLVQALGIEPGDLLRLGAGVYRVETLDGAIVQLRDALAAPAAAGAAVEKLIALEAFDLRNLQEHALYVGHKELLKLDGPAAITLALDPPALAARLAGLDLDYHMWGTRKNESDPDWHELDPLGAGAGELRLAKSWEGSVDELELPAGKSRWLRIRLSAPIAGACGPPTRTISIELKVRSIAAPKETVEGSQTIAAAFYNGQPLPTSSAFFPFGTEPQRFDIFALSAPEALSKKGARVTLTVKLNDASLRAMAYTVGRPASVYGVSADGRLQSILFGEESADWRQLGLAPARTDAGPGQGVEEGAIRLDPAAPLFALSLSPTQDLVVVRDVNKLVRLARVDWRGNDRAIGSWLNLPAPTAKPLLTFCLVPAATGIGPAALLAADAESFYIYSIGADWAARYGWTPLVSHPTVAAPAAIAFAGVEAGKRVIAVVDGAGGLHRGDVEADRIGWSRLDPTARADGTVRPIAWLDGGDLVVVAARGGATAADDPLLIVSQQQGQRPPPRPDLAARIGDPKSILALGWKSAPARRPLIAVTGDKGMMIWSLGSPQVSALPADVDPASAFALLLPGLGSDDIEAKAPSLVINAGSERLVQQVIGIGIVSVGVTPYDILWSQPGEPTATHVRLGALTRSAPLPWPWLRTETGNAHPVPAGALDPGDDYLLLRQLAGTFTGTRTAAKTLTLAAKDLTTDVGDFLDFGGELYPVTDVTPAPRTATLDRALPTKPGSYRICRPTEAERSFLANDRAGIARLDSEPPAGADEIAFPAPADPRRQPIAAADGVWLLLGMIWNVEPGGGDAQLAGAPGFEPGMQVRLPREADNPELSWEYYDGEGWRRLDSKAEWGFADGTLNLAKSGGIAFQVPRDLAPTEIAGKEDYWIRARLAGGDYGRPAYLVTTAPKPPAPETSRQSIIVDRSHLNPPEILSIEANYVLDTPVPPDRVVADNNLAAIDQTQAALEEGAVFNMFEGVAQHVRDADGGTRALYLGFGKAPGVQALNLYADAVDRDDPPRELIAEALTTDGWQEIGASDKTFALTRPGMLRLYLTPAPAQLPLFGRDGWWLRLRPAEGAADWAPLLRGLHVNAVIAEHAKSVRQEIVGSSLGEPDQIYALAQKPVLPATLELRVREALGEEERAAIQKVAGAGAIVDDDPDLPGEWVLWEQVDTFVGQDGDARVYRLDPGSGQISFGNGRCGKIPPAGRDSIRAFSYQAGGGSGGNVAKLAIANLGSAIESVELAMNPVDAAGGADAPRPERLAVTAPSLLRHAGRALAPADIEALAVESAPDVVRARCLARKGCSIDVAVAIKGTGARCPVPSRARREGIARNIADAGWGALAPDAVRVHPPRYVHVAVEAAVLATSPEAVAGVDYDVRKALVAFLHPVDGGPGGLGWPFGGRVWPSDLERAIADIEGLDRVVSIALSAKDPRENLDAMPPDGLICVEEDEIDLIVEPPEDSR